MFFCFCNNTTGKTCLTFQWKDLRIDCTRRSPVLMHLTETFAVKLLQIVVSDVSPKQVLPHILLIELTTIINFSRLNVTQKGTFMTSQIHRGSSVNQKQM